MDKMRFCPEQELPVDSTRRRTMSNQSIAIAYDNCVTPRRPLSFSVRQPRVPLRAISVASWDTLPDSEAPEQTPRDSEAYEQTSYAPDTLEQTLHITGASEQTWPDAPHITDASEQTWPDTEASEQTLHVTGASEQTLHATGAFEQTLQATSAPDNVPRFKPRKGYMKKVHNLFVRFKTLFVMKNKVHPL